LLKFCFLSTADFAYVGKRTTGTEAGDYLISGPGWEGAVPRGVAQISSPNDSVLVIGRVFVASDSDLPTAYALTKLVQVVHSSFGNPASSTFDAARSCSIRSCETLPQAIGVPASISPSLC
jgi:hypothetical protein